VLALLVLIHYQIATPLDRIRRAELLVEEYHDPSRIRFGPWAAVWDATLRWSVM
jgi:hypothetical protein